MRKFYLKNLKGALLLIALFVAQFTKADVSTITDLYGKYHFTATVDVKDATLQDNWSSDCEVIITKDAYGIFDAQIEYLAGAKGAEFQKVTGLSLTSDRIRITNPNGSNGVFAGGVYMADFFVPLQANCAFAFHAKIVPVPDSEAGRGLPQTGACSPASFLCRPALWPVCLWATSR